MSAIPTLAIVIVCADHIPERAAAMQRLIAALGEPVDHLELGKKTVREWSEGAWYGGLQAACEKGASHILFLNDDLLLCPDFLRHVRAAIAAKPDDVVSFHPNHPKGAKKAREMGLSWVASYDGLVGTAYCLPADLLSRFLAWRGECLLPEALDYPEDAQIGLWCMSAKRDILHSLPGLFLHDPGIASLFNHDQDPLKQPCVTFHEVDPETVNWATDALHVGNVYRGNMWCLVTHLRPGCRHVTTAYEMARATRV
jgi:hypothetical protein